MVLHPSNLVQLIQFWVPRTPELEGSLVDALRLPLFFQSFDPEDEKATVKVLESISRFENVADFPEETLKVVLTNQALRSRLRDSEASNDEVFALVREEVLSLHQTTLDELESTQGDLRQREKSLDAERQGRAQAEADHKAAVKRVEEAEAKASEANQRTQELEAAHASLEKARADDAAQAHAQLKSEAARRQALERGVSRQWYFTLFYLLPAIVGGALAYGVLGPAVNFLPALGHGWMKLAFITGLFLVPVCVAFILSPRYVAPREHLNNWAPVRIVHFIRRKLIVAPFVTGGGAIWQGGVWDGVKAMFGGSS